MEQETSTLSLGEEKGRRKGKAKVKARLTGKMRILSILQSSCLQLRPQPERWSGVLPLGGAAQRKTPPAPASHTLGPGQAGRCHAACDYLAKLGSASGGALPHPRIVRNSAGRQPETR